MLTDFINKQLDNYSIGAFKNNYINKLEVLLLAKKIGLKIPETIITTKKQDVLNFIEQYDIIISKSISDFPTIKTDEGFIHSYTSTFQRSEIINLSESFFPTLFQELICKKFDVRIVYFNKQFFSGIILSQKDKKTKIDFRRYNLSNPNRINPIELPIYIKQKLISLMDNLNLNLGVIDMVYSIKKEFVFLEVNPIGQFGNISKLLMHNIEKRIAKYLINETI